MPKKVATPEAKAVKPAPVFADAVGSAAGSKKEAGQDVQKAMEQAIRDAYAQGITDPKEIKKRMAAARQAAKDARAAAAVVPQKAQAEGEVKK